MHKWYWNSPLHFAISVQCFWTYTLNFGLQCYFDWIWLFLITFTFLFFGTSLAIEKFIDSPSSFTANKAFTHKYRRSVPEDEDVFDTVKEFMLSDNIAVKIRTNSKQPDSITSLDVDSTKTEEAARTPITLAQSSSLDSPLSESTLLEAVVKTDEPKAADYEEPAEEVLTVLSSGSKDSSGDDEGKDEAVEDVSSSTPSSTTTPTTTESYVSSTLNPNSVLNRINQPASYNPATGTLQTPNGNICLTKGCVSSGENYSCLFFISFN